MLNIISTVIVVSFVYYMSIALGPKGAYSSSDLLFLLIAIPVVFIPSYKKSFNWIKRARHPYLKVGRVMAIFAAFSIIMFSAGYIPISLRTQATKKYVEDVIKKSPEVKTIGKIHILEFNTNEAKVLLISAKNGKQVILLQKNKTWQVKSITKPGDITVTYPCL